MRPDSPGPIDQCDANGDGDINFDDFLKIWRANGTLHERWVEGDVTGARAITGGPSGYPCAAPDDYVNVYDLFAFADRWLTDDTQESWDPHFDFADASGAAPPEECAYGVDGKVDIFDLTLFADNWHSGDGPVTASGSATAAVATRGRFEVALQGAKAGTDSAPPVVLRGEDFRVVVSAAGVGTMDAYEMALKYDSKLLSLEKVEWAEDLGASGSKVLNLCDRDEPGIDQRRGGAGGFLGGLQHVPAALRPQSQGWLAGGAPDRRLEAEDVPFQVGHRQDGPEALHGHMSHGLDGGGQFGGSPCQGSSDGGGQGCQTRLRGCQVLPQLRPDQAVGGAPLDCVRNAGDRRA